MAEEVKGKGVSKWLWWIPVLLVAIGLAIAIGVSASNHPTSVANKAYEYEYKLSAGQKVYTKVKVGQGTNLQLWASKPFNVVTDQLVQLADGTTRKESREYWMPGGESSWTGGDPVGLFTLRGETDGTIVRIKVL